MSQGRAPRGRPPDAGIAPSPHRRSNSPTQPHPSTAPTAHPCRPWTRRRSGARIEGPSEWMPPRFRSDGGFLTREVPPLVADTLTPACLVGDRDATLPWPCRPSGGAPLPHISPHGPMRRVPQLTALDPAVVLLLLIVATLSNMPDAESAHAHAHAHVHFRVCSLSCKLFSWGVSLARVLALAVALLITLRACMRQRAPRRSTDTRAPQDLDRWAGLRQQVALAGCLAAIGASLMIAVGACFTSWAPLAAVASPHLEWTLSCCLASVPPSCQQLVARIARLLGCYNPGPRRTHHWRRRSTAYRTLAQRCVHDHRPMLQPVVARNAHTRTYLSGRVGRSGIRLGRNLWCALFNSVFKQVHLASGHGTATRGSQETRSQLQQPHGPTCPLDPVRPLPAHTRARPPSPPPYSSPPAPPIRGPARRTMSSGASRRTLYFSGCVCVRGCVGGPCVRAWAYAQSCASDRQPSRSQRASLDRRSGDLAVGCTAAPLEPQQRAQPLLGDRGRHACIHTYILTCGRHPVCRERPDRRSSRDFPERRDRPRPPSRPWRLLQDQQCLA